VPSTARGSARKAPDRKAWKAKRINSTKAERGKQDSASNRRNQLKRRTAELTEARAQHAATADMLKTINRPTVELKSLTSRKGHERPF
jgi:hypothetical protein